MCRPSAGVCCLTVGRRRSIPAPCWRNNSGVLLCRRFLFLLFRPVEIPAASATKGGTGRPRQRPRGRREGGGRGGCGFAPVPDGPPRRGGRPLRPELGRPLGDQLQPGGNSEPRRRHESGSGRAGVIRGRDRERENGGLSCQHWLGGRNGKMKMDRASSLTIITVSLTCWPTTSDKKRCVGPKRYELTSEYFRFSSALFCAPESVIESCQARVGRVSHRTLPD